MSRRGAAQGSGAGASRWSCKGGLSAPWIGSGLLSMQPLRADRAYLLIRDLSFFRSIRRYLQVTFGPRVNSSRPRALEF
ncbi:uncharacterized protein METZ01_LOCUS512327, partial [marine metagenome]